MTRLFRLFLLFNLFIMPSAYAEKGDENQPTDIQAENMVVDDMKQVSTFSGNVVLTKGTILMKGETLVVTTNAKGYRSATLTAAAKGLASFRQKRDGGPDLWLEGQAERIEYDEERDIVKLFSKAEVRRLNGRTTTDEVAGAFISYDSRRELYSVNNTPSGVSIPGAGRVRARIQTQPKETSRE